MEDQIEDVVEERPWRNMRYVIFGLLIVAGIGAMVTAGLLFKQRTAAQGLNPEGSRVIGRQAPDFTLKNVKGEAVSLRQFKGQPVLLFFCATW